MSGPLVRGIVPAAIPPRSRGIVQCECGTLTVYNPFVAPIQCGCRAVLMHQDDRWILVAVETTEGGPPPKADRPEDFI